MDGWTGPATYELNPGDERPAPVAQGTFKLKLRSHARPAEVPAQVKAVEITPYSKDLEPLVKAFNVRLRNGGEKYWSFPESHVPRYPNLPTENPHQEFFLACEHGAVRGGYLMTHSQFAVRGETTWIACGPQLNLSEGIVNRSYGMVGAVNVRDALKKQPLLYGLGMGGFEERQAKLLAAMKWPLLAVPFFFKVLHPSLFFANIAYLRKSRAARFLVDLLRYTGFGWLAVRVAQFRPGIQNGSARAELCHNFDAWADEIWRFCKDRYSLLAVRNSQTLNRVYPSSDSRFLRLRVSRQGKALGWAVLLDTKMCRHKHFGNMRVGSIVDCLAEPEDAVSVVRCSSRFLEQRGVDLVVSNQASSAWGKAFTAAGYLTGPTNFILALSPLLAARLEPLESSRDQIHMNRGDGDGPINL